MKNPGQRDATGFQAVAAGLLIVFISVTTFADLFHHHRSFEQRSDCPACLWHQMSQDAEDGPNAAELVTSCLSLTDELLWLCDGLHFCTSEISLGTPIRAPPTL